MQTSTDFNVHKFTEEYGKLLFWLNGISAILFFCTAIYSERDVYYYFPFILCFFALALLNFKLLYFLMLIVLPVSVESYIGGFGTDLPSEPIVILLAGCTMLYLLLHQDEIRHQSFKHPVFIIILLQLGWSIFDTLFSTDVILSVKYVLAKSWYLLGFFVLPMIVLRDKRSIKTFFWCLFIPTLLSVIFVMIRHGEKHFTFDSITHCVRPIYRNHVSYAVFITMLLPFIFLAKTWYPKNYLRYRILKYSIPLFLAAIYFSYTRGAWLATGAMFVYYMVIRLRLTKAVLIVVGITVTSLTTYVLKDNNYLKFSPDFEHTIYHDELSQHLTSTFEMEDMSTVERFYRWIAVLKMFKQNPIVGVGPNNFVSNYKQYTVTAYETYISDNEEKSTVHNYFLLLLAEQGLPALLIFVLLVIAVLLTAQKAYTTGSDEQKKYVIAVTLCIVAFLVNNSLSDLVETNKLGSLFLMCLGILVNISSGRIDFRQS